MSTLTTIQSGDLITNSRTDINNNFSALNTDKMETSVLDTDTTLAANSDSKVATQKAVKAYVDANSVLSVSSETTTGVTHSLTTDGSQRVIVWVKGNQQIASTTDHTILLKYNSVTKDTVVVNTQGFATGDSFPFSLMYTETPNAGTANITVTTDTGSLANVVIIVMKFNV